MSRVLPVLLGAALLCAAPATAAPKGPSVATVQRIVRSIAQADHLPWLPASSIEVDFTKKTRVGKRVKYDPYGNDPLHPGGPINAWPVKAWITTINHHDDTPEDDTHYSGCNGHLDSVWPHDMILMFYKDTKGHWTYGSTNAKPRACG